MFPQIRLQSPIICFLSPLLEISWKFIHNFVNNPRERDRPTNRLRQKIASSAEAYGELWVISQYTVLVFVQIRALLCRFAVSGNTHQQQPSLLAAHPTVWSFGPRYFHCRLNTGSSLLRQNLPEHAACLCVRHLVSSTELDKALLTLYWLYVVSSPRRAGPPRKPDISRLASTVSYPFASLARSSLAVIVAISVFH